MTEQLTAPPPPPTPLVPEGRARRSWGQNLSFRRISAVYIFIAMFAIFSLWVPDTFLSSAVWRSMLDIQALNALVAIALVIPLAAGVFDLAIGAEVAIGAILVAWFISERGYGIATAVTLSVLAGVLAGVASALLVERAKIDSFIATLGMSSILFAMVQWVSGNQQIVNLGEQFQAFSTKPVFGITAAVWIMLIVAAVAWYLLECTPAGRKVYATGGNRDAARLAGVNTAMVTIVTLAACGGIAALAGVLQTSRIATGDPTVGPGFLLPAFAAAFLGSTQFKDGRYNIWGAVVSVYVLATGVKGLQLAGAPVWIPELFNGVALLLAVGMAVRHHANAAKGRASKLGLKRRRRVTAKA